MRGLVLANVYQTPTLKRVYCALVELCDVEILSLEILVRDHSKLLEMVPIETLSTVSNSNFIELWPYLVSFSRWSVEIFVETCDFFHNLPAFDAPVKGSLSEYYRG